MKFRAANKPIAALVPRAGFPIIACVGDSWPVRYLVRAVPTNAVRTFFHSDRRGFGRFTRRALRNRAIFRKAARAVRSSLGSVLQPLAQTIFRCIFTVLHTGDRPRRAGFFPARTWARRGERFGAAT